MVRKFFFNFFILNLIIFLTLDLWGYDYLFESCETTSAISWSFFGDVSLTNYCTEGANALKCIFNQDGSWNGAAYSMYEIARTVNAGAIVNVKKIKIDVYNPYSIDILIRIFVTSQMSSTKWQFSIPQICKAGQWTTISFDFTDNNWNPINEWNWPDTGEWDKYLSGKDSIRFIYLYVFKNDGNNINLGTSYFIIDNIRFEVDNTLINFEDYDDLTMTYGSKKIVSGGSSITDYICNNAYEGTQALKIDYNISGGTNGTVILPQIARNFTNFDMITLFTKGTGTFRLLVSESAYPPAGIVSDGEKWISEYVSVTNEIWQKVYFDKWAFTVYGLIGNGNLDLSYITNLAIKVYTGNGTLYFDKIEGLKYYSDYVADIIPTPGSIFSNAYGRISIIVFSGLTNDFDININGTDFNINSPEVEYLTNGAALWYINITNMNKFNSYNILKIEFKGRYYGDVPFTHRWTYFKKDKIIDESIIDNFEKYYDDYSIRNLWLKSSDPNSSITVYKGDTACEGEKSLKVCYNIITNGWVFVGRDLPMIDFSQYQYIQFYARGWGNILIGVQEDLSGSVNLDGEVWASSPYPLSSGWQKYIIPIDSLNVTGGSKKGGIFDKSKIRWIEFDFNQSTHNTNRETYIDDIRLIKDESEFKLLMYIITATNEIFLQFNNELDETEESLKHKVYFSDTSIFIQSINFQYNTGGVVIRFNKALDNNRIYRLTLESIRDKNSRKFSDEILLYNLIANYVSGDIITATGGVLEDRWGNFLIIKNNTFDIPAKININKLCYTSKYNKNFKPLELIQIDFQGRMPHESITLLMPFYRLNESQFNENNITIAYYDGVNWIPIKSERNKYGKYLIADIEKEGIYGIVELSQKDSPGNILDYSMVKTYPDVLSPNGDGINDEIKFGYYLNKPSYITIKVFTLDGVLVKNVTEKLFQDKGFHSEVTWNGESDNVILMRGIYLYKISAVSVDNPNLKDEIVKTIIISK